MPRLNRKVRRRVDPDVLPEDFANNLLRFGQFTTEQLETWLANYPDGDGLARLLIGRELTDRIRAADPAVWHAKCQRETAATVEAFKCHE